MSALSPLFAPRGIVVVGASRAPGKLGTAMTSALEAGGTPLALVNTRGGDGFHADIDAAVSALRDRGAEADLLVSCVPAGATASVVREAGEAGISAALVCAGGFAEVGGDGIQYQHDLAEAAQSFGIRVLGPNTSGFFVPSRSLRASFVPGAASLRSGRVAVVASSGGVNHMTCFRLARAGVGISIGVGLGAGFDVTHADVLDHLRDDADTSAIVLHLESVADGAALLAAVRNAAAVKPVVALVVGRRSESAFAQSHTGALATSWRTTRSLLAQAGAVVVDDDDDLVAAASALAAVRLPPTRDAGVALITGQAGPGLMIDDEAERAGWRLPRLADATLGRLRELLPPLTFLENPIDTGRPGPTFPDVVRAVSDDPGIDLLAIYTLTEPVIDLPAATASAAPTVPVLLGMDGPAAEIDASADGARREGIPFLTGPSGLAAGINAVVTDARIRSLIDASPVEQPTGRPSTLDGAWDEIRAKDLLDAVGIATPDRRRVHDLAEARRAIGEIGFPVAVKMVDATVLHKTDVGGVRLGISSDEALTTAMDAIRAATGAREFLIERMAPSGVDLVASVRRDPVFGAIAVVGLGGTSAEAIADVAIRSLPLGIATVRDMLDSLQGRALLHGWRGGPVLNDVELSAVFDGLGGLLVANPGLVEIEINPLRVTTSGLVALDAVLTTR